MGPVGSAGGVAGGVARCCKPSGRVLAKRRDAGGLARCMIEMIRLSPEARKAMGHRGRRKMEAEFDERRVVAAYLDTLNQVGRNPG